MCVLGLCKWNNCSNHYYKFQWKVKLEIFGYYHLGNKNYIN